jgi:dTDP-4-dehydrorhamnose 3,5-epimerase-like enzyme
MNEKELWPKEPLVKLPEAHADERGAIQPLCDLNMKSASLIFTKKNSWRANHYHKSDWHYIYVLSGTFEYYYRKTNSEEKIKKLIVKKGELLFTPPLMDHAMLYTEDTSILVVSKNPRDQKTYEEDTVRIKFKN